MFSPTFVFSLTLVLAFSLGLTLTLVASLVLESFLSTIFSLTFVSLLSTTSFSLVCCSLVSALSWIIFSFEFSWVPVSSIALDFSLAFSCSFLIRFSIFSTCSLVSSKYIFGASSFWFIKSITSWANPFSLNTFLRFSSVVYIIFLLIPVSFSFATSDSEASFFIITS